MIVDKEKGVRLVDSPDFPAEFKVLADVEAEAFLELRERANVNWIYVCPPAAFRPALATRGAYSL